MTSARRRVLRWWMMRRLGTAIECVLLDHFAELDGDEADANLVELAIEYQALTGWTAARELTEGGT